jgi:Uma2 family endonuclease
VTVTTPHYRARSDAGYTVGDLFDFPDDGYRYEIFDGSLVVTPPPAFPHTKATTNLRDRLYDQAPRHLRIIEGVGVYPNDRNYFIPDLGVIPDEVLGSTALGARPQQTLLVIEVVSPSNPSNDLVFKRDLYARCGIPEYWIVDRRDRSLTVLQLGDDGKYAERAVLHPGETWRSDFPFPLHIDPGEIF